MTKDLKKQIIEEIRNLEELGTENKYVEPKKMLHDFISLIDKKEYTKLANYPTYDFFLLILACSNIPDKSWEEIKKDAATMKTKIQAWDYNKVIVPLENLAREKRRTKEKYGVVDTVSFQQLGFTKKFEEYIMRHIYYLLSCFLEYKEQVLIAKKSASNVLAKKTISAIPPISENLFNIKNSKMSPVPIAIPVASNVNTIYMNSRFKDVADVLRDYDQKIIEEDVGKRFTKEIDLYEHLLELIENKKIHEYRDIPAEWISILAPAVIRELYFLIQSNILMDYKAAKKENKELKSIVNKTPLTSYLYSKNINPSDIEESILQLLEEHAIEKIKPILDLLLKIDIDLNDISISNMDMILKTSKEKLTLLNFLADLNIISKTTFINNVEILTTEFNKIKTNYEILKDILDFSNEYYNDFILLLNTKELKNRLDILKEYNLTKNNFTYLLCNYKMLNIYDLLLENDIPTYLFISICKTKNPFNTIKRIIILKRIDESYIGNRFNLKKDVTEETKFICDDEDLDKIIQNVVPFMLEKTISSDEIKENEITKQLDEIYLNTKDTYMFGKVMISRPKVLRNMSKYGNELKMEELLRIMISGSIFESPSIYEIQNALQQKKLLM